MKFLYISLVYPYFIRIVKFILYIVLKRENMFDAYEKLTKQNQVLFFKTLYFNMRSLPLKQALKIPIFLYSNTEIISSKGKVKIEANSISTGMIRWGWFHSYRSQGKTRINNNGCIVFHGSGKLLAGSEIAVFNDAKLEIGESFFIGENTMIFCAKKIYLGKYFRLSYCSQICDSDFHYMINIQTKIIKERSKPIYIGDYNWITNNLTIKKGVVTPHHIVCTGPYSVLIKDYSDIPPFSILAGNPVKLIVTNCSRIWKNEMEYIKELDIFFNENNTSFYKLKGNEVYTDYTY